MKVLWLITARAGSKGIPKKNIKPLAGVPLMGYVISSLLTFAKPEDVIVSTDSPEFAAIARELGSSVPYLRSPSLANDNTKSVDVALDIMEWAEAQGRQYDVIAIVQPTSPFTKPEYYLQALELFKDDPQAAGIISVKKLGAQCYYAQKIDKYLTETANKVNSSGLTRRQDVGEYITPSGGFFIAKWDLVKVHKTFYFDNTLPFVIPEHYAVDLDEPVDWMMAEFLLEQNLVEVTWVRKPESGEKL